MGPEPLDGNPNLELRANSRLTMVFASRLLNLVVSARILGDCINSHVIDDAVEWEVDELLLRGGLPFGNSSAWLSRFAVPSPCLSHCGSGFAGLHRIDDGVAGFDPSPR